MRSVPGQPPNPLNYSNPGTARSDREIKRRWRRLRLKIAMSVVGTVLVAILILALLLFRVGYIFYLFR
jgi:hypothetical protein